MLNILKNYTKKSILAVLDQGAFSGSGLFLNIMLARWLSPESYGAFVVAYSFLILLQSFYAGVFYEPITIFGSGKYKDIFFRYMAFIVYGHLGVSVFLLIIFGVLLQLFFKDSPLGHAFLGLGISMPFILLFNIVRRSFYVDLRPAKAALNSLIYFFCILLATSVLNSYGWLSPFNVFLSMAFTSGFISLFFLKYRRIQWCKGESKLSFREVLTEHFKYGRWTVGTHLLNWVPTNIYFIVFPIFIGLRSAGALRAMLNFALPVLHLVGAWNLLFLPVISRKFSQKNIGSLHKSVELYTAFILVFTIAYWIMLILTGDYLKDFLYKGKYEDLSGLFWLIGSLPLLYAVSMPRSYALRAIERPDKVFLSSGITALSVVIGLALAIFWGLKGAIVGLIISALICCLCIFGFYWKSINIYFRQKQDIPITNV